MMETALRTLSVLVDNEPGVLSQISRLFSRKGFNIESLAVGPTQDRSLSRLTLAVIGEESKNEALTDLLREFGILEMVRTGMVALERGRYTIQDERKETLEFNLGKML